VVYVWFCHNLLVVSWVGYIGWGYKWFCQQAMGGFFRGFIGGVVGGLKMISLAILLVVL